MSAWDAGLFIVLACSLRSAGVSHNRFPCVAHGEVSRELPGISDRILPARVDDACKSFTFTDPTNMSVVRSLLRIHFTKKHVDQRFDVAYG